MQVATFANVIMGVPQRPAQLTAVATIESVGMVQDVLQPLGAALNNRWIICREDYEMLKESICNVAEPFYGFGPRVGSPGVTQSLPHMEFKEFNNIFSLAIFKYPATFEYLAEWVYYYAVNQLTQRGLEGRVITAIVSSGFQAAAYSV